MTRKNSNLQKFPHVPKNEAEKTSYFKKIRGGFDETLEDDTDPEFSETLSKASSAKNTTPANSATPQTPRQSFRTTAQEFFSQYWLGTFITIILALGGWMALTLVDQGKEIATLKPKMDRAVTDVQDLQTKYSTLNDGAIKSGTILEQVQKDLELLKSRLLGK